MVEQAMRSIRHIHPALLRTLTPSELKEFCAAINKTIEELKADSRRDYLTGLLNQRGFQEDFRARLATRASRCSRRRVDGSPVVLLFIDIDHFKKVNDTHGHDEGNKVLKAVAEAIRSLVRPDDLVARWGGEEIVVCLPDVKISQVLEKAEAIRAAIAGIPFASEKGRYHVTVSIGAASTEGVGYGAENLEKMADAALYEAKRTGRNRVVCASARKHKK